MKYLELLLMLKCDYINARGKAAEKNYRAYRVGGFFCTCMETLRKL